MSALRGRTWAGGYAFTPFTVQGCSVQFEYAREEGRVGGNVAAVWVKGLGSEASISGVLQGRKVGSGVRGAGMASRVRMAQAAGGVGRGYEEWKRGEGREAVKREVRGVLGGWVESPRDDFVVPEVEEMSARRNPLVK